jgi:two-component system, OmpR family, phosphate regulon sensor histidine kinase PhoR
LNPIIRRGLYAPGAVATATLLVWLIAGSAAALVVMAAGAGAIIAFHLWCLKRVADWAHGPLEADVPEGRGEWAFLLAAIHRRTRMRREHERDLRHTVERFRQAVSAIPDGVVVLDATNRIDWANERALVQLGLDLHHDHGQPVVNLVRQPEFLRYIESDDYSASIVVGSSRDPGRRLALQLVPFAADQKLLMSRDVTELEAVARMRRDFIASVSHELKTPLTVISGFVETLQDVDVDKRQRQRFLALMQEQASSMRRLVQDLLALSALESEHNAPQEQPFAVTPLLTSLAADARALSHDQHRIELDIADASTIVASRDEIASAFGNLVSNAVRYTPRGGTVTLRWSIRDGGRGEFAVLDTGIGISAEHIPRLTERFYRVDRSRSRATGGTGLGLAIVKHVLLRHQAELEIESEVGRGSRFAAILPAQRVEPQGTGATNADAMSGAQSGDREVSDGTNR